MNEHPACVTRGDGTVDDGGTNSFWRDFATRVAHGRERVVEENAERAERTERKRERRNEKRSRRREKGL